ncbi:MAG: hypothetical protein ACYC25_11880, partial [Paludibacter sp.]
NSYVHFSILKNVNMYNIIINACKKLKDAIREKNDEKVYDLADTIHCLPDIIAENDFKIPNSYWKSHVKCYRDKWDNEFLRIEQKVLKRIKLRKILLE